MKTFKRQLRREYHELRATGRYIDRLERIERALNYLTNRGV